MITGADWSGRAVIVGTGVDLAEVERIRKAVERFGPRFLRRVYTPAEIAYVERKANRFERYAARFAAKEAGMKAIGTGWRHGVCWQDFEISNLPSGRPILVLHGKAAKIAKSLGCKAISLSLTHTSTTGMAFVILEGEKIFRRGRVHLPPLFWSFSFFRTTPREKARRSPIKLPTPTLEAGISET